MSIPKLVHFCWIGPRFPWAYVFAVLSAARHAGADQVILHHTDELAQGPELRALQAAPAVRLARLDPRALLDGVGAELGLETGLSSLYARLSSPAILSDILRAAILYREGGIYLDVDTLTVAPLTPLLDVPQFLGTEFIVWPYWVKTSRSPAVWARTLALDVTRKALRITPEGWRLFRKVEGLYYRGINGAIMGGEPKAPLLEAYLQRMAAMPPARQAQPNALGPDLLQIMADEGNILNLAIHEPARFYPLPPEISQHWFRPCRNAPAALARALRPETLIAHWYASVRTKPYVAEISPGYIRAHRQTQLYSALVSELLPELPEGA